MRRIRDFIAEWKARRAGAKYLSNDLGKSARHITGPTGNMFSNGWDLVDKEGGAFLDSFDRRVPPSLFISQQERSRQSIPIPLVERCIEDYGIEGAGEPTTEESR